MAPHSERPPLSTEGETPSTTIHVPQRHQLEELKKEVHDEQVGGSEHAATPPIEIRSGTPVRQGTPRQGVDHGSVTEELLAATVRGDEDAVSVGSSSGGARPLRARGSSISFHPRVTDDSGDQHSLQGATSNDNTPPADERSGSPKNLDDGLKMRASVRRRALNGLNVSTPVESPGNSDSLAGSHAPRNDLTRRIIMGTDTGLADDSEYLDPVRMASLTSGTTSPSVNEARTPLGPVKEYFVASPTSVLPPQSFPSLDGKDSLSRRESRRRERAEVGSRRASRRSSARSTGMSASSSWLAGFGRSGGLDDAVNSLQEPDARGKEFGDDTKYVIGEEIGRGGFSVIKEVQTYEGGDLIKRAVKIVRKRRDGQSEIENDRVNSDFDREVDIWRYLHHPYILRMIAVYETDFASFCVMDHVTGGTLLDMLRAQRQKERMNTTSSTVSVSSQQHSSSKDRSERVRKGLEPAIAKRYIYQIASALRYLHEDVRVVHRDVKLENCLLDMSAPDAQEQGGNVLLCDFGLADYINNEGRTSPPPFDPNEAATPAPGPGTDDSMSNSMTITLLEGSLEYSAPELIGAQRQLFSPAVDMWALGVCAYALIAGAMPFSHQMPAKVVEAIQRCDFDIGRICDAHAASEAPSAAVELVRGCLEPDPALRWSVEDVLDCLFLEGCRDLYEPRAELQSAWS